MKRILSTLSQKWPEYILEILVITIGILGAFALNNWNDTNQNKVKEELILSELNREFSNNKEQLNLVISIHERSLASTKCIIKRFPINPNQVDLDSLGKEIWNSLYIFSFNPSLGTLNSLINSSSFELITNPELRSLLVSWKDIYLDYSEDEVKANQDLLNHATPYFNRNFPFHLDLKDPRFDKKILSGLTFENQIRWRNELLLGILQNDENELQILVNHMDRIIELTK